MRASSVEQIILAVLAREHAHLTSQAVHAEIRKILPAVNHSTVYRALERLADEGKVSISDIGIGATVYESLATEKHHHLVCQKCGQVFTLPNGEVQAFFGTVEQEHSFKITTNHLILFGLCGQCAAGGS